MDYTDDSEKTYMIETGLLDMIIDMYENRCTDLYNSQEQLLKVDPNDLRMELAVAHGVAKCLQIIYKHSTEEIQHDIAIRTRLFGTQPRTDRSRRESTEGSGESSSTSTSGESWLSS